MSLYTVLVEELLGEADTEQHLEVIFDPDMSPLKGPMTSKDVGAWQWALRKLGYNVGPTGVDRKFGEHTDAATRKFQEDNRTTVDGIAGPRTLSIMNSVLAKKGITEIPGYKSSKLPVKAAPVKKEKKEKTSSSKVIPNINGARQVFTHMKQLGFSDVQSAAWVGCIAGESGFDPNAKGKEVNRRTGEVYYSHGIVQWNADRFKKLQQFAKKMEGSFDAWKDNLNLQLHYLSWELENKFTHVVQKLKKSEDNIEKSLYVMIRDFEMPADTPGEFKRRLPIAQAALSTFGKKNTASDEPSDDTVASNTVTPPVALAESVEIERIKYLIKF
jgi:peptidoglycan hydrolase-like protein with peptidoglycan-binding domain